MDNNASPARYGLHGWQYPAPRKIRPVARFLGTVLSWLFILTLPAPTAVLLYKVITEGYLR